MISVKISLALMAAYLLGSIPFAYLAVKAVKKSDLRQFGSGNLGTTNVLRAAGPALAAAVFTADLIKGTAAVALARFLLGDYETLIPLVLISSGLAAMLGHSYSWWLKGSGGRGVATGLGVLLGIAPDVFLFTLFSGLLLIAATRYISVGSLGGSLLALALMFIWRKPWPYIIVTAAAAALIWWRHRPNIKRLLAGTENRLGRKVG